MSEGKATEFQKERNPLFEDFDSVIGELQNKFNIVLPNHRDWKNKAKILLAEMNAVYESVEEQTPVPPEQRSPKDLIESAEILIEEAKQFEE